YTSYKGYEIKIVDLPGIYSLTAHSIDEIVARNFIIEEKPDVIVNILDSSNLERNLYLSVQLMKLGVPVVLVFNMIDMAERQGFTFDKKRFQELLNSPVVFSVASQEKGMKEILEETVKVFKSGKNFPGIEIKYDKELEREAVKIEDIIKKDATLSEKYPSRWLALKLLEGDDVVKKLAKKSEYGEEILQQKEKSEKYLNDIFGDTPDAIIADGRYGFISGICSEAVRKTFEARHSLSDKIDSVLINRILGLPIFLFLMWVLFKFTFAFSEPLMSLIEMGQEQVSDLAGSLLPSGLLQSLLVDGVIGGVGSVLVFVPIIFLLFFAMAVLEDSGYMARAAFIMDKFMHKIGLHGRSFIPLLLGFGCNLPAIMAARTIEDERDRLVTILVNPFMSCGARLPVYTLFIGSFFTEEMAGNVLFSIYFLGVAVSIGMAAIFRRYLLKGEAAPFVMELPPYRLPTLKGVLIHMWERGYLYLRKAGTIIFAGCLLVWFLSNFPFNPCYSKNYDILIKNASAEEAKKLENEKAKEKLEKSYAGILGKTVAPVFKPLGFGDWKIGVGLIGGFVAKEIVVGTLGTLYSVGEADEKSLSLRQALQNEIDSTGKKKFNPLVAYSFMVFVLLYIPCVATVAVIKRETNSWKWPIFTIFYTSCIAWMISFLIYQGGKMLGLG
ncbi:MAG: ferrous iron transport protein B, partial [Candidatus Nealsonbacteria bacterium]